MRMILALALLWPGLAVAQFIEDGVDVGSPHGPVRIVETEDGWERFVLLGDRAFFRDGAYRYVALVDRKGGLILVQLSSGGTACPAEYAWLNVVADPPFATEVFGNCSDLFEVAADAETVSVILPAMAAAEGRVAFVYDGQSIRREVIGQAVSGIGPEAGAEAWIGRYPFELFRAAEWRPVLVGLMGEADYVRAGDTIQLASPMERQGDWVVGSGCIKFSCLEDHGAIALNLADGRVLVALRNAGRAPQLWGDPGGVMPAAIAEVLADR